ncbi:MAG: hybrid sensor histidine kinase/response regulator, partial [Leptothrix sp. (in: Bacteria)]|nr:hybrid sensor histidine kinase/response regulator [Leptothrix sp. (in: b-proteobacteria)]
KVLADATRLHQVLLNLCTNAWQALQGQPGTVTVGLQAVTFGEEGPPRPAGLAAGRYARLGVSDSGCGIDAATRERLFEPFFTTRSAQGGTGLGLSMVHGIVSSLHGGIAVHSSPGQGSRFDVYLPLHDQPAAPASAEPGAATDALAAPGRGQRILYFDDDEVMALTVERLLERAGYTPSCHTSAEAGLAAVREQPTAYDLVVTDFHMPEVSGLDVSRRLASLRPELPVLMISGYIFDELPAQAHRAGVRELIRKQHVLEDLLPAIARALNGR